MKNKLNIRGIRSKLAIGFFSLTVLLIGATVLACIRSGDIPLILFSGLAALLSGGLAFFAGRNLSCRLNTLGQACRKMAAGDFTGEIGIDSNDEIGAIARSCRTIQKQMNGLILQLKENTIQLNAASEQLVEIAGKTGKSSPPASSKTDEPRAGGSPGERVQDEVAELTRQFEELRDRSLEIGKIVAIVDDIASRTNILALNTAIEAARAGESEGGFAVVSDEVRRLAERTATATGEIADLVNRTGPISLKVRPVNTPEAGLAGVAPGHGDISEQPVAHAERAVERTSTTRQDLAPEDEKSTQGGEILAFIQTLKEMAQSLEQSIAGFKIITRYERVSYLNKN